MFYYKDTFLIGTKDTYTERFAGSYFCITITGTSFVLPNPQLPGSGRAVPSVASTGLSSACHYTLLYLPVNSA